MYAEMINVEYLVEDVNKSDQDAAMGTDIYRDKFSFVKGKIHPHSIDGFMMDSEETIMIFLQGAVTFIKYDKKVMKILNEL